MVLGEGMMHKFLYEIDTYSLQKHWVTLCINILCYKPLKDFFLFAQGKDLHEWVQLLG